MQVAFHAPLLSAKCYKTAAVKKTFVTQPVFSQESRKSEMVARFDHFVTGKSPQADARGDNPVRKGGDFAICARVTISPKKATSAVTGGLLAFQPLPHQPQADEAV
jgi:hypothetical protein